MKVSEKDVSHIWLEGRFSRLRDEEGNDIEVVFGGRQAAGKGCDFQDAVLKINGIKCCGDVEIHVSSDLWKKHGHDRDHKYNNVILHVALWEKGGLPALLYRGINIPTVILGSAPAQFSLRRQGCPHAERLSCSELEDILRYCGLQRLSVKARGFMELISIQGPQQALYSDICRALGYSRNKVAMSRLAELMPFRMWQEMQGEGIGRKMAIAMGISGLLPSQANPRAIVPSDSMAEKLEREWEFHRHTGERIERYEWCFSGIRPANSPLRRVAALCCLMDGSADKWLQDERDLMENIPDRRAAYAFEAKLMLSGPVYWSCHYDFGRPLRRPQMLLGRGRTREITVNSILPFFLARAWFDGDEEMTRRVADFYCVYPPLPENEITRYMQNLLLPGGWQHINGGMQQGLLHIFHSYCQTRDCSRCPVFMRRRQGWGQRQAARYQSARL